MSYRWDIEEGAAGASRRADELETGDPSGRSLRPVVAVLLLFLALLLGWRYLLGRRFLAELRREIQAAVLLEEQALVGGDAELYLRQQSLARARLLRHAPALGGERYILRPPLPGLNMQAAPGSILAIEPDFDSALGQPIRRATVSLRYAVSDSLGAGSFVELRPYVLSPKGRWIHTTPNDEEPLESDVRHPERAAGSAESGSRDWEQRLTDSEIPWQGRYLRLRYLPQDAERLPYILARAEALMSRYCRAAEHCDAPAQSGRAQRRPGNPEADPVERLSPVRLRFSGNQPGLATASSLPGGERYLKLPSPALTLAPEDAAAEDLVLRQILRLALLSIADAGSSGSYIDAYGRPQEDPADNAPLLSALIDAWLAAEVGLPVPRPPASSVALPAWAGASPLLGIWTEEPSTPGLENVSIQGIGAPTDATRRSLTQDFALHLSQSLGPDTLARLIAGLPNAKDPQAWLAAAITAESDTAESAGAERATAESARAEPRLHEGAEVLAEARVWALHASSPGAWAQESGRLDMGPARATDPLDSFTVSPGETQDRLLVVAERDVLRPSPRGASLAVELAGGRVAVIDLPAGSQASEGLPPPEPRWIAEGSDPQWSPDGTRLAVLRLDEEPGNPSRSDARLLVLDAASGQPLAEAAAQLPSILALAAGVLDAGSPSDLAPGAQVRLRVGDWSPDGRWATLVAGLRIPPNDRERSDPEDGYDWRQLLALDSRSGQAKRFAARGDIHLDARERFVRWPEGEATALLLHYEPLWSLVGYQFGQDDPDAGAQAIATRFLLERGRSEPIRVSEARARPEILGLDMTLSPDGRWQLRSLPEYEDGQPRPGRTAVFRLGQTEPVWVLDVAYCSSVDWAP